MTTRQFFLSLAIAGVVLLAPAAGFAKPTQKPTQKHAAVAHPATHGVNPAASAHGAHPGNLARSAHAARGVHPAQAARPVRDTSRAARGNRSRTGHATIKPPYPLPPLEVLTADPPFPAFDDPAQVTSACTAGLEGANLREKRLEKLQPGPGWLQAWDELYAWQEDKSGALIFLENVHPDATIRAAAEACETRWRQFDATLGQDEKIYLIGRQSLALLTDPIDHRAVQVALEGFEDAGVALPADRRARARDHAEKIAALGQQFNNNIRDSRIRVAFTTAELKGVPDGILIDKARDADGRVLLGVEAPTYSAVMQGAIDPAARERMWRAKLNEGGADNLNILWQIEKLRLADAKQFGSASYADFVLRRRMAENSAKATKFLADMHVAVADQERRDIEELRAAKARALGQPLDGVKIERWDTMFYAERLQREKLAFDDEALRPYFPPQESLRFVMRVAEKMFGVRYDRMDVPLWAPEVQGYAVVDVASGRKIATLYIDPYAREGKYNHAAVWTYRNAATSQGRLSQAALVVNLNRKGLTLEELETLMHEFARSLHSNLSATRYASDGGTNVMQDFVEAPSQMLERWVYDKKVLKVFQEVCPACRPVPDDLVDRARAAEGFDKGLQVARQLLYADYDLALHGTAAPEPMGTWQAMEAATPLGTVSGTMFPAGFAHIASGYGAGYYGYLWSEVVALDMRTAFGADLLDPAVGARYRADVLAQGGQKPPQQLVRDFLGRDTSPQAFFDDLRN